MMNASASTSTSQTKNATPARTRKRWKLPRQMQQINAGTSSDRD
ncbi:unnamed protein product [Amoebophrya sp. A25]|nr:unnamed protein product [Amoebophrya sp. A25]|eukprot:GSA25T00004603001.1